jgi:hypothetical protein
VIYDLRSYERQASNDLLTQAEVVARAAAPGALFNDARSAQNDLTVLEVRPRVVAAAVYTREGKLFATYVKPGHQCRLSLSPWSRGLHGRGRQPGRLPADRGEQRGRGHRLHSRSLRAVDRLKDYLTILLW